MALIGGKRGAEDVDAPVEEPARAPAGSRALFEPKLKSVPAPAGSRALFEPKLRPKRRKHTMSGLLGNVRPRSLSPSKKARKRERERYAQQPSTGVQVKDAPEPEDPLAGFEDVPEPDELAGFEDVPPGGFPGEKAAALPATKPAGAKQQPAATVTRARPRNRRAAGARGRQTGGAEQRAPRGEAQGTRRAPRGDSARNHHAGHPGHARLRGRCHARAWQTGRRGGTG